jgi:hypothetical protein
MVVITRSPLVWEALVSSIARLRGLRVAKIMRAEPIERAHDAAMNFTKNIGMLLLAIYLIVVGIIGLTGMGAGILLPILALVAGIFILIGR